jgi:hypothetical protein
VIMGLRRGWLSSHRDTYQSHRNRRT